MLRKVMTVSTVAAALILGGCSSAPADGKIQPSISQPTGSLSDLNGEIKGAKEEKSPLAKSIKRLSKIDANKLMKDTKIDVGGKQKSGASLGASVTHDAPACITDGIVVSDDETSASGTLTFNHCDFDGVKIDGSFTLDFSSSRTETSSSANYKASAKINFQYQDVTIDIGEAKTEGSETRIQSGSLSTTKSSNQSGITAYLQEGGEKLLILDGINTDTKSESTWNDETYAYTRHYEFTIAGYVGSDATGMFELKTPKTVKGSSKCPTEGKITVTDRDGNVLSITAENDKIITNDGTDTEEFPCGSGSAEAQGGE